MTSGPLRQAFTAEPFRPFNICLADGRKLRVTSREMMSYPGGRTAAVWIPREDAFETVDVLMITSIQPAAHRNGKKSKR
jgi:hypothetical protein